MNIKTVLFLAFALTVNGCGPTQKITGSWADPEAESFGPYTKAFVMVLSQNSDANYYIESQIINYIL